MSGFALITGASKGIGKSMASSLAARGYNLLLVARSEADLNALQQQLQDKYQIRVHILVLDLSLQGAAHKVAAWIETSNWPVTVLINNAGYGLWGDFAQLNLDEQMNMLQLNISSLLELTYLILPRLKSSQRAYILNVSSTAAYQAVPTLALYAASKSFVLSFTRALRYELKPTSVKVTCLSPGPVDTGFAERAGLNALSKMAQTFNMKPDEVAEIAIRGMFKGKSEIIPGFTNLISAFATRLLPKVLIESAAAGIYKIK